MGCGASSGNAGGDLQLTDINQVWIHALQTVEKKGSGIKAKDLIVRRSGWKTVRVFVSSTFKDFHAEREVLVKKVFPDLRLWCESRRIQLIDCDLRWGVPKDSNTEGTLRACLGEIDRCYQDNIMPFFLNMTSERAGWVPELDEVPDSVRSEYRWIEGLSVTEMEIMHGAYRRDNPNALFMLRDPGFLGKVPEEHRKHFVDGAPLAPEKLKILKEMIKKKFQYFEQSNQVTYYKVEYLGINERTNVPELGGIDGGDFSKVVYDFFKKRITMQYPLDEGKLDPYQAVKEQHESFMKSRCTVVLGRDDILKEANDYVTTVGIDLPLMLVAGPGTGKSSLLTKIADDTTNMAMRGEIPGGGGKGWHVFYHFVGAVPASTELEPMLKRLLKEMGVVDDSTMPSGLENTAMLACSTLSSPNTKPTVIIVDALNQFDEELPATQVTWVPRKLAPQIRCIFSMIPETAPHKSLVSREPLPKIIEVAPLSLDSRKLIVTKILGNYNKMLDAEQMNSLMSKSSSENPLWLSIACEELRVFGMFRQILDKINHMADGLLELEMQVMERFERENGGELVVATLCLLEASSRGLLETELLSILVDEDNLMPREEQKEEGAEKDDSKKEKKNKDMGFLPMFKWSEVYRALKPFIRPFGDSGEGRLDFYHRSLSKAIRKKYFQNSEGEKKRHVYKWWHKKLADYFENVTILSRKLEEYPIQLIYTGDKDRLESFLTGWDVFDALFDFEYSGALIKYWRIGPGFERMESAYRIVVNNFVNSEQDKSLVGKRLVQMARFIAQAGRYDYASELAEQGKKMEEDELGSRPEQMADVLYLSAFVADERMKLQEYMYRSQLTQMKYIIENFEKAAAILKTYPDKSKKKLLGSIKNRLAFYYSGYSLRGGDTWLSKAEAQEKSTDAVDEAIQIFKDLDDIPHLADATTTKGVSFGNCCSGQIKAYKEAEEMIYRVVGKLHPSLDRLYLNQGIYYEESGDYNKAYEYFRKWYENCRDLYGVEHPRATRTINTLREPMYKRIAQEKGDTVPEMPSNIPIDDPPTPAGTPVYVE